MCRTIFLTTITSVMFCNRKVHVVFVNIRDMDWVCYEQKWSFRELIRKRRNCFHHSWNHFQRNNFVLMPPDISIDFSFNARLFWRWRTYKSSRPQPPSVIGRLTTYSLMLLPESRCRGAGVTLWKYRAEPEMVDFFFHFIIKKLYHIYNLKNF